MTAARTRDGPDVIGRWRPGLVVLLALLLAPRAVDEVIRAHVAPMLTLVRWHAWLPFITVGTDLVAFVLAGLLIDRLSVAPVACLSLIVWAALTALSASVANDPLLLFVEHGLALFVGIFFGLAANVAAKLAFPLTRRARVLANLNIAATGWLLVGPTALHALHWPPNSFARQAWAAGSFPLAGFALVLAALSWRTLRPSELDAAPTPQSTHGAMSRPAISLREALALLRRRGMLALVLVMACHMLAFSALFRILYLYLVIERSMPRAAFLPAVVPPLLAHAMIQLAVAHWSDVRARRSRDPAAARTPFVIVGAALTAAIGLIPLVSDAGLVPLYWIVALGMTGFPLVYTLGLDVVPASFAARFLGVAMAIVLLTTTAIFIGAGVLVRPTHSYAAYFYFAGMASLTGAVIAFAKLRQIEPIEDGPSVARRLGEVFA